MGIHILKTETFIKRPLSEVFAFFSDAGNLSKLTPDYVDFTILTPLPIDMFKGALIDYKIKLFGIPFKWQTRITEWSMPGMFQDSQIKGPYKTWIHTHSFFEENGGVRMIDEVKYESPGGFLEFIPHNLFVKKQVEDIFKYREKALAELLP